MSYLQGCKKMDMMCTISRDMPQEDILRKKISYGICRYWRCSISKKCSKGVATRNRSPFCSFDFSCL